MTANMRYGSADMLIAQAGIDPNTVSTLGVTAQGYWEPQGRRGDAECFVWRSWPSQQIGSEIYQALNPR